MRKIDLNVDLGEGSGNDLAMLEYATSVNIACGWHAGDAWTMRTVVKAALERGIAVGAHPGYPDRENFGRRSMELTYEEIYAGVQYQVGALDGIVRAIGGRLVHVKPHGALYNDAERSIAVCRAIVCSVRDLDPSLVIYGLAGGQLVRVARELGMQAYDEAFADRGYAADGRLLPRAEPGAVIHDVDEVTRRVSDLLTTGTVRARDGNRIRLSPQTLCLHGDGERAVIFAQTVHAAMGSMPSGQVN
ncbi:LamB/YcsF family protein [Burkholderia ambifaria IOP40-10]|uniref:LamB/YcsF family protein n=1 Tax=Burkholderia ambifaria IOP40-10 TaxID=396596 RepID=B1F993_9BURK|nr:5-oxoprolinase subunit PxpA [Burkholderia ambifaria]EDT05865.1 LamB/YcsF family protein [Burkholderia ambifaria IOP40-10]